MVLDTRQGLLTLVESDLSRLEDAQLLREQSMISARLAGLNADGQTRFSAAVSEMARHILDCGDKGDGALYLETDTRPQNLLAAFTCKKCEYDSEEAERKFVGVHSPKPVDGPRFACRVVDFHDSLALENGDVKVLMGMEIPAEQQPHTPDTVNAWMDELSLGVQNDPLTELKRQNESLRDAVDAIYKVNLALGEAQSFFGSVLDTVPNPVFYQNIDGQFLGCNGAFERAFSVDRMDLSQEDPFKVFGADRADALLGTAAKAIETGEPQTCEVTLGFADDTEHHLIFSTSPFTRPDGNVGGTVGLISDITAQKQLENELRRMATTDPLTGASNRRHFLECAWRELSRHRRQRKPVSLIMLDIDHFKGINDSFGHSVGDKVLKALVDACTALLREMDLIARIGGEEFIIMLPDTGETGAIRVCEKIRKMIDGIKVETLGGQEIGFKVSMGVAESRSNGVTIEELMRQSDSALYSAKRNGRDRVALFDPQNDTRIVLS